jgi:hypothetical protein
MLIYLLVIEVGYHQAVDMSNGTAITFKSNSLVATAVTAVLKCLICLLLTRCLVLEVNTDAFKLDHNYYLLLWV